MSSVSLVYRNIFIYRLLMNGLYTFGYRERFNKVIAELKKTPPKSVLDLCFGDVMIPEYCKKNNIAWTGFDANDYFVAEAVKKGFDAHKQDIVAMASFPTADTVVMVGSLYHFNDGISAMLKKMLAAAKKEIIISEPVKNLSSMKGPIGYIARQSADAGKGNENFRYDEQSLLAMLKEQSAVLNFSYEVCSHYKKDIIIRIRKNGAS